MSLLTNVFQTSKDSPDAVLSRRLEQSIGGAGYWVTRMPREAVHQLRKFQRCNIAAAAIAFITGILAWPLISHTSLLTACVALSVLAAIAALTIVAPQLTGLGERTEESIKLCGSYATIYGELLEAQQRMIEGSTEDAARAIEIIRQYENVTARNEALAFGRTSARPRLQLTATRGASDLPSQPGAFLLEPPSVRPELNAPKKIGKPRSETPSAQPARPSRPRKNGRKSKRRRRGRS
ncbi:hypothetical protein [Streptomyces himalayensis]|uniref:SLATT domain-containing protein n=1 Tax=Streptomyces himalayensis subsp. himalayensis TaxID=2756131 RepID=A0A7W0ICU5_9ACTN|nr:hypothetical protein [Streptomyces himalayensis]MBA2950539.1 hypothetical protein [Streptomyces himalayensis subsp. himalayensis]